MLKTRLLTAAILGPIIVAIVLLGEPWMSVLVGVVAFLAFVELVGLLDAAGHEPPQMLTILAGMAITTAGLVTTNDEASGLVSHLVPASTPGLVAATLVSASSSAAAGFTRFDPRADPLPGR